MEESMRRAIGVRLRDARLAANLKQEQVATDFLRTRQAISSWESGRTLPTLLEFRNLLTLYGVSSDKILFGGDIEGEMAQVLARVREPQPDFQESGYE